MSGVPDTSSESESHTEAVNVEPHALSSSSDLLLSFAALEGELGTVDEFAMPPETAPGRDFLPISHVLFPSECEADAVDSADALLGAASMAGMHRRAYEAGERIAKLARLEQRRPELLPCPHPAMDHSTLQGLTFPLLSYRSLEDAQQPLPVQAVLASLLGAASNSASDGLLVDDFDQHRSTASSSASRTDSTFDAGALFAQLRGITAASLAAEFDTPEKVERDTRRRLDLRECRRRLAAHADAIAAISKRLQWLWTVQGSPHGDHTSPPPPPSSGAAAGSAPAVMRTCLTLGQLQYYRPAIQHWYETRQSISSRGGGVGGSGAAPAGLPSDAARAKLYPDWDLVLSTLEREQSLFLQRLRLETLCCPRCLAEAAETHKTPILVFRIADETHECHTLSYMDRQTVLPFATWLFARRMMVELHGFLGWAKAHYHLRRRRLPSILGATGEDLGDRQEDDRKDNAGTNKRNKQQTTAPAGGNEEEEEDAIEFFTDESTDKAAPDQPATETANAPTTATTTAASDKKPHVTRAGPPIIVPWRMQVRSVTEVEFEENYHIQFQLFSASELRKKNRLKDRLQSNARKGSKFNSQKAALTSGALDVSSRLCVPAQSFAKYCVSSVASAAGASTHDGGKPPQQFNPTSTVLPVEQDRGRRVGMPPVSELEQVIEKLAQPAASSSSSSVEAAYTASNHHAGKNALPVSVMALPHAAWRAEMDTAEHLHKRFYNSLSSLEIDLRGLMHLYGTQNHKASRRFVMYGNTDPLAVPNLAGANKLNTYDKIHIAGVAVDAHIEAMLQLSLSHVAKDHSLRNGFRIPVAIEITQVPEAQVPSSSVSGAGSGNSKNATSGGGGIEHYRLSIQIGRPSPQEGMTRREAMQDAVLEALYRAPADANTDECCQVSLSLEETARRYAQWEASRAVSKASTADASVSWTQTQSVQSDTNTELSDDAQGSNCAALLSLRRSFPNALYKSSREGAAASATSAQQQQRKWQHDQKHSSYELSRNARMMDADNNDDSSDSGSDEDDAANAVDSADEFDAEEENDAGGAGRKAALLSRTASAAGGPPRQPKVRWSRLRVQVLARAIGFELVPSIDRTEGETASDKPSVLSPLFCVVKMEYLAPSSPLLTTLPPVSSDKTAAPVSASPNVSRGEVLLEAFSPLEMMRWWCMLRVFPDATLLVYRVHAYTRTVLDVVRLRGAPTLHEFLQRYRRDGLSWAAPLLLSTLSRVRPQYVVLDDDDDAAVGENGKGDDKNRTAVASAQSRKSARDGTGRQSSAAAAAASAAASALRPESNRREYHLRTLEEVDTYLHECPSYFTRNVAHGVDYAFDSAYDILMHTVQAALFMSVRHLQRDRQQRENQQQQQPQQPESEEKSEEPLHSTTLHFYLVKYHDNPAAVHSFLQRRREERLAQQSPQAAGDAAGNASGGGPAEGRGGNGGGSPAAPAAAAAAAAQKTRRPQQQQQHRRADTLRDSLPDSVHDRPLLNIHLVRADHIYPDYAAKHNVALQARTAAFVEPRAAEAKGAVASREYLPPVTWPHTGTQGEPQQRFPFTFDLSPAATSHGTSAR